MNNISSEIMETKSIRLQTLKIIADPVRARLLGLFSEGAKTKILFICRAIQSC